MFKWTNGWAWVRRAIALTVVQLVIAGALLVGGVLAVMRLLGIK